MDATPLTRSSLLLRLRHPRDEQAWAEFAVIYSPLLHRFACRRGLQDADAADLVQDIFGALARALERGAYDPARGPFRAWLFRVARNLSVNYLIRQQRQPRGSGDTDMQDLLEAQPAPHDSALFDIEVKRQLLFWAAEQIRDEFSELTWQAFWRAGVEGCPASEVAQALGTTVGTVYHYKSRVMARLRKKIEQVAGEG
jgi:RNA polymerase sigma-70 factor (ECF subfamily)